HRCNRRRMRAEVRLATHPTFPFKASDIAFEVFFGGLPGGAMYEPFRRRSASRDHGARKRESNHESLHRVTTPRDRPDALRPHPGPLGRPGLHGVTAIVPRPAR